MKRIIRFLIVLILIFPVYILVTLLLGVVTDYHPDGVEDAVIISVIEDSVVPSDTELSIMTYNIGYGGLDASQDFFVEGGKNARPETNANIIYNTDAFVQTIKDIQADFIALQEVDVKSRRSYGINQVEVFDAGFGSQYALQFAHNFKVNWIPKPWTQPTGNVESGLLTLSKYSPISSKRFPLPSDFPFPEKYFMLDRCFIENVYEVDNGKKLYFINLHLSAYDENSNLKLQQINYLKNYVESIIEQDDYIVLAGDYNMVFDQNYFDKMERPLPNWVSVIPASFYELPLIPIADYTVTTTRSNEQPYIKGENFETVIDGFFISQNIDIVALNGINLKYENSDHNPVVMKIILNSK